MIQVGLDSFSELEREWLLRLMKKAEKGTDVGFDVEKLADGRQAIRFLIGTILETIDET